MGKNFYARIFASTDERVHLRRIRLFTCIVLCVAGPDAPQWPSGL